VAGVGRQDGRSFAVDWGREVAGYLDVEVSSGPRTASVWWASEREEVLKRSPESERPVLLMPRQRRWRAPTPGRFRYVLIDGLEGIGAVRVYPILSDCESQLAAGTRKVRGPFGLPVRGPRFR
jgi:hypothetical protein